MFQVESALHLRIQGDWHRGIDVIKEPLELERLGTVREQYLATLQVTKEKRKVGRPIAHCGDPDSPHLTPAERRRIKRRIANRESARRVRAQRQDSLNRMSHRIQDMKEENAELAKHASAVELEHAILTDQLRGLRRHLHQINVKNYEMAREIANLRSKLNVRGLACSKLELLSIANR